MANAFGALLGPGQPESVVSAEKFLELVKRADKGSRLRIATRGADVSRLEEDPEAIVGKVISPGQRFGIGMLLIIVSVVGVYLITFNAWDDEGFFPWFWNVIWVLFPWFFLGPAWLACFKVLRRQSRAGDFAAGFDEFRARAVRAGGTTEDLRVMVGENGRVIRMAVEVAYDWPRGTQTPIVAVAPHLNLLQTEIPQVGAPAYVWIGPDQQTRVVQIAGAAAPSQPGGNGQPDVDIAESLAKLAELHAGGALSDESSDRLVHAAGVLDDHYHAEDLVLHLVGEPFDVVRTAERVDHVAEVGLLAEDVLRRDGDPRPDPPAGAELRDLLEERDGHVEEEREAGQDRVRVQAASGTMARCSRRPATLFKAVTESLTRSSVWGQLVHSSRDQG